MGEAIRVLLVDDHPIVTEGLASYLGTRDGIEVVGTETRGRDGVARAVAVAPDVVVMDLLMPEVDGVAATRRISEQVPGVGVLVLTSHRSRDAVLEAVEAGAAGYLLKDAEPAELERAIRTVAAGGSVLDPETTGELLEAVRSSATSPLEALTPRERDVLELVGRGLSNHDIAGELVIAEKTVKTHVSNVLMKLGVDDRTQAALVAVGEGLVRPGEIGPPG